MNASASPAEIVLAAIDAGLATQPGAVSLQFQRARTLEALGRDGEAEAAYTAVLQREPRHFRALNDLGLLYHRHQLAVNALNCFLAAVEADPANATGHANLGAMLLAGDDPAAALERFERALALAPGHPAATQGRALARERLGLPPEPPPPGPIAGEPAGASLAPGLDPFAAYAYDIACTAIVAGEDEGAQAFLHTFVGSDPRFVALLHHVADFATSQRCFAVARATYEQGLRIAPDHAELLLGRAIVLEELGETDAAEAAWTSEALLGAVRVFPYTGSGEPIRVLTIASALHAIRFELFVDATTMLNTVLYTQGYRPGNALPPHDVVLVAVADVESDARALDVAAEIVTHTGAPIVNHPARIARTSRTEQAVRLRAIDGVVTANVQPVERAALVGPAGPALVAAHGFTFPLLLRSPGFHNGRFFELVERETDLARVARDLPTDEVLLIDYHPTRGPDGLVRKLRAMTIDGALYPVHLAISRQWKVHYVTSAMADDEAYRREEQRYLDDMTAYLGARGRATLEAIAAALDLDYGGIDFGVDADGRIVVFEANGAMAIFTPDADPRWDYRRPAMGAALRAATAMLERRALAYRETL